jgi:hypothetical protein
MSVSEPIVLNVVAEGMTGTELQTELTAIAASERDARGLQVRLPCPAPGGLPMMDPGTVQIILALVSGGGVLAITIREAARMLGKLIDRRNAPLTVKFGPHKLELSPNIPAEERERIFAAFIDRAAKTRK